MVVLEQLPTPDDVPISSTTGVSALGLSDLGLKADSDKRLEILEVPAKEPTTSLINSTTSGLDAFDGSPLEIGPNESSSMTNSDSESSEMSHAEAPSVEGGSTILEISDKPINVSKTELPDRDQSFGGTSYQTCSSDAGDLSEILSENPGNKSNPDGTSIDVSVVPDSKEDSSQLGKGGGKRAQQYEEEILNLTRKVKQLEAARLQLERHVKDALKKQEKAEKLLEKAAEKTSEKSSEESEEIKSRYINMIGELNVEHRTEINRVVAEARAALKEKDEEIRNLSKQDARFKIAVDGYVTVERQAKVAAQNELEGLKEDYHLAIMQLQQFKQEREQARATEMKLWKRNAEHEDEIRRLKERVAALEGGGNFVREGGGGGGAWGQQQSMDQQQLVQAQMAQMARAGTHNAELQSMVEYMHLARRQM
eukprot:TRINITY_DN38708_c0_g1_i1.p1 TRINITY_DN38708_c0_g1~~TRINITY_DN38708_c0_g1_i1.p1  ORF type:complete len:424 (-),score=92.36 TRINITY_DN38708_c0_g1_i1:288-1559(-)